MKLLQTSKERMLLDEFGRIVSFTSLAAPEQEWIVSETFPAFMLQYKDKNRFVEVESCTDCVLTKETEQGLECTYHNVGGLPLHVTLLAEVRDDSFQFTASLENQEHIEVTGIGYPMIIVKYGLGSDNRNDALLYPRNTGVLYQAPEPFHLEPDSFHAWRFLPENGDTYHYPGQIFAQFLAYYNNEVGIYAACDDITGQLKLIKPVHRDGLRLGFFHAADWRNSRNLGYHIILKSFCGDWYQAADLYRQWSGSQHFSIPLSKRNDIPEWLLDSPPHVVLRIKGRLDEGPATPNDCFQPYEKAIPILEQVAKELDAPLAPIIMSWENKGPWVYPDCFPPAGGDDSLSRFTSMARERGWHVGSYCNGTRWVTANYWSGYNGTDYLAKFEGEKTFCHTIDGKPWKEHWDMSWRESYPTCLFVEQTRKTAEDFCRHLMEDGLDYIQFLDQNVGCTAFPCYSTDHGHPPMPGKWMTDAMEELGNTFVNIQKESGRPMTFALEQPCCEYFMPYIQICDVRVGPPGHSYYKKGFVPLAMYLFHEYMLFQGAFGCGQEPYHLPIRTAANLVWGAIPGGVLTDKGDFVNRDHPMPWAAWEPPLGNAQHAKTMIKNATALRRGIGKPYLVYGKMQPPANIQDIEQCRWQYGGLDNEAPALFHAAWEDQNGRYCVILANWTDVPRDCILDEPRLGCRRRLTVPALDCLLIEQYHR